MSERSHGRLPVLLPVLLLLGSLSLGWAEFRFPSGEGDEEGVTESQEAARRSDDDHQLPGEVQTKTKITVSSSNDKHLRGNRFQIILHWLPPPSCSVPGLKGQAPVSSLANFPAPAQTQKEL